MKLKEIHRTSTFAWSPTASLPLLATGTVAGALDESFSNESQLEIWAPNFLDRDEFELGVEVGPKGVIKDTQRFNRLAWGAVYDNRPHGVIAAGLENGELALWDPAKIVNGFGATDALIMRNTPHKGPVRGLDFNPIQTNLLASGAVAGEVFIWDVKDPSKPYAPTTQKSGKLDEITSVAWNQQVQYVLAGASSTGYTVVWDLRGKREVVSLAYGGGAGTQAGQMNLSGSMAVGGRRGMSDIAWHPDNATRLVTASEDDSSPVIMVWDLRNARAPEKILTGHDKGVLSLSWCKQDADLLLSCGKDNRALCWNPQTSEIIGELPSAENWAFQVDWCPRNPDLFAAAFFDGTIGIHSVQSTNEPSTSAAPQTAQAHRADGSDIFDMQPASRAVSSATLSLKQPPKWLRRPNSAQFGFGGKLVSVSNLPNAQGKNQSSVVHIRKIVTEQDFADRATKLQKAIEGGAEGLQGFAEELTGQNEAETEQKKAGWKALLTLFKADSREELVTLLGFSKEEIAARVAEAVKGLQQSQVTDTKIQEEEEGTEEGTPHEPVVSLQESEGDNLSEGGSDDRDDKTPSEVSVSTSAQLGETESTTTVPSLFGDDDPSTPHNAGGDFFSNFASQSQGEPLIPHTNYGVDSSVAATIGSRPASVTSDAVKSNIFRIYPSDESEVDQLVTKALVLGDFESAVTLCISSDRFADAILLAVRGGPELLEKTQKAYFERRTTSLPYLRLFQSIVTNDLSDIVQNADLQEWQEIFVVLCTFASKEEFPGLAEQLGRRLEFQFTVSTSSENAQVKETAKDYRENATLTYLAAARLERLVNIWIDELTEEEKKLVADEEHPASSQYSAHTHALQTFVEKVTVFRAATSYKDVDLAPSLGSSDIKQFKLGPLYDRYLEYADLLTTQGLLKEAITFLNLTPGDYKGSNGADFEAERARLLAATGVTAKPAPAAAPITHTRAPTHTYGHPGPATTYQTYSQPATNTVPQPFVPVNPVAATYAPSAPSTYAPSGPSYPNATGNYQNLTQPPHLRPQAPPGPGQIPAVPPPPRVGSSASVGALPPPPKRQENGGWNDAPNVIPSRTASAAAGGKPAAITAPFPNSAPSPVFSPGAPYTSPAQPGFPPPRPGSVTGHVPPPPRGAQPPRPASRTMTGSVPPPPRMMSPPQGPPPPRQPTPGQYAPPPQRGPVPGQTPPPSGPYGRPPIPGQQMMGQPAHMGPPGPGGMQGVPPPNQGAYGAPPQQGGPYSHPAGMSPQAQQQQQLPPTGPYAPPPGAQRQQPPVSPSMGGPGSMSGPPMGNAPPPPGPGAPPAGPASGPPRPPAKAPVKTGPPPPKYPPGDRSHIPEAHRPAFEVLTNHLNRMKQQTPPQQRRVVEDLERRLNNLFDALNCETLSPAIVDQLLVLTKAMDAHDRPAALAIHVDLLTRGSATDDIGIWMSGVKQLIMRM